MNYITAVAGLIVGIFLGRRARHRTVEVYVNVDIRRQLAQIGRAFRGRSLSGTTFRIANDSEAVGSAHGATEELIQIAKEADRDNG